MTRPASDARITEDDAFLAEALRHASVPTLLMSIIHLTGDATLLEGPIRPQQTMPGDVDGGLSDDDRAAVRAMALAALRAYRDRGCTLPPLPSAATIRAMMSFMVGAHVPDEYVPMFIEEPPGAWSTTGAGRRCRTSTTTRRADRCGAGRRGRLAPSPRNRSALSLGCASSSRRAKEPHMHIGMGVIFQGQGEGRTDRNVYRNDLRLADLAEPLGFESLWGVEHHFTDYTMCPDVLQYLTYFAGRTRAIQLGSMVVVLPWHQPVRVAEQVLMLDHLSNGRLILGIGRGLGRVEFEGFGVNQEDSRGIFVEAAQMILEGLERGYVEFDGTFVKQQRRELRPRPFKSFRGRTYAAAVSPESSQIMAKLGIGILIIPQKPWEVVAVELNDYRQTFRAVNGIDAPPPIVGGWTYCDENADRAAEYARAYIGEYWRSVVRHYELVGDHLTKMRGYESYRGVQEMTTAPGGIDLMTEFFLGLQVWGTPEQCYERILDIQNRTGAEAFNGVFSYGAMPYDLAESSVRLFAAEVMPELRKRVPIEDQLIARAGVGTAADAGAFRLPI